MTGSLPTEINHIKARGVVRITWDDGHVGEYAETYLRGYCPCARRQAHRHRRRRQLRRRALLAGRPQHRHLYLRLPALALSVRRLSGEIAARLSAPRPDLES